MNDRRLVTGTAHGGDYPPPAEAEMEVRPALVAMDLEGVLVPEVWINVADVTGVAELKRTTRDEPDYDALMRYRLAILEREDIRIHHIQDAIGRLAPLPGAKEVIDWVRQETQLIILSDTFYQFATPLMRQLDWPTLFCHRLEIADDGRITGYRLRLPDQKRAGVQAFRALGFRVLAFGDSYNDTTMLAAADRGVLFRPSAVVVRDFPQYTVIQDHAAMRAEVAAWLAA